MKVIITRLLPQPKQTLGKLELFDTKGKSIFECKTLELPWLNNQTQVSCIPTGNYEVKARTSPKYGLHYHIQDVPKRSFILIHQGNYNTDILGCILVGQAHTDINGDGVADITSSKTTLQKLLKLAPDGFQLQIK